MKRIITTLIAALLTIFSLSPMLKAEVIQLDPGTYQLPQNYNELDSIIIDLDHDYFYTWCLPDLPSENITGEKLEIVFHGVYDWTVEEDYLRVYIRDGNSDDALGWSTLYDEEALNIPNWSSDSAWTLLGIWSDPAGHSFWETGPTYDVVFTLNIDPVWAQYLSNGGSFVIGLDPDCHYFSDKITVNAPVPEPATLLLLGAGLLGLAGIRRRMK